MQQYKAENSFFNCCKQGAYVYSSLADFYADANGYLANPNRTTSPITPRRYPDPVDEHSRAATSRFRT